MLQTNATKFVLMPLGAGGGAWPSTELTDLVVLLPLAAIGCLVMLALIVVLGEGVSGRWRPAHDAAQRRAEAMLGEFLSESEQAQLQLRSCLSVPSPSQPGRFYVIPGGPGLVKVYQDGRQVDALCVQPWLPLPGADLVLVHKLMIECCEDKYLAASNRLMRESPVWHW
ncbi:MAG: hypothetical protein M1389_06180 [Chloroflexi bacterium]|nr:hypothetical protein [Chloroflexota bacterium]